MAAQEFLKPRPRRRADKAEQQRETSEHNQRPSHDPRAFVWSKAAGMRRMT